MKSKIINDINNTYEELALIHQDMLSHLEYLHIYALNYIYVDFEHQTMVISGTESKWVQYLIEHNLHQNLAHRLREHAHAWHADSKLFQTYQTFMQNQHPEMHWQKTDYCLKGKHGMHLLEIGHTKALGIDATNQLNDAINTFKHESIRLKQRYPSMHFQVCNMAEIRLKQAEFAKEDQAFMDSMKIKFDMSLFEPPPEPVLTELEDQALSLRVQWFEDDEIADAMQCSLKDVKALFISIKEKYHQPNIPQRVYSTKRKQLFPELFAQ